MRKKGTFIFLTALLVLAIAISPLCAEGKQESGKDSIKIAVLVKSLGNGFFEAVNDGAVEASGELGDNVEIIYQGPSTPTAEGQIEIIETLIAQKVDGIAISANDKDALVPVTKKAMKAGIKVISFDSGVAEPGRALHLAPSDTELIGQSQVKLISDLMGGEGQFAVLSASSQATNQNAWIEVMQEEVQKPKYNDLELVSVVYGDDVSDKSYREAVGLIESYPDLGGIVCPTTVGIAATAKAVKDLGLKDEVEVTGLGLPSEMQLYVEEGICDKMALWNPIDLGYTSTYILYDMITNGTEVSEGTSFECGRMGEINVGEGTVAIMGEPFEFTKENIAKYAKFF